MNKKTENYAFIDSQNLIFATKSLGWEIDFERFYIYLHAKYGITKAFLFMGYISENKMLYEKLKSFGYKIIFKPVVRHTKKEIIKGNVDAELVLHAAKIEFHNYEKAIIISNDGDFHCLVEHLVEENKLLKLITPSMKYSSLLRRFSSFIVPVPLFKLNIRLKYNNKKRAFPRYG